ncbi:MAG: acyl carrier protein [Parvibaculaceae bacterium]
MEKKKIEDVVISVIKTILKTDTVEPQSGRENLPDWNSLRHIEIVFAIEDELGVAFSEEEMGSLDTVEKIVQTVMTRDAS